MSDREPYNAGGFIRAATVPTEFPERAAMRALEEVMHNHFADNPQEAARDAVEALQKAGFSVVMRSAPSAPAADPVVAAIFDGPGERSTSPDP